MRGRPFLLRTVYPRPHGEAGRLVLHRAPALGLSPPTRGSLHDRGPRGGRRGSIPAHTGKPRAPPGSHALRAVYPRPHGEAKLTFARAAFEPGLSPPTRGSQLHDARCPRRPRSIPAHTGKPTRWTCSRACPQVYPRPHGEAPLREHQPALHAGLSPPTRGSPDARRSGPRPPGSIPAHTGKPRRRALPPHMKAVYPRPHGEAGPGRAVDTLDSGLSPPTRGSLSVGGGDGLSEGSIPAHTGKPRTALRGRGSPEVYPRPHGEADEPEPKTTAERGLSPPTRGSRRRGGVLVARAGSIPAHTGKPAGGAGRLPCAGVYPRPHGEALGGLSSRRNGSGLSPPTRGSHRGRDDRARAPGSIPAHTGKPATASAGPQASPVYPRPHGEASVHRLLLLGGRGLSPPTRGSQHVRRRRPADPRSIPAHTGKPLRRRRWSRALWVYPRPHGEASALTAGPAFPMGLSPPTRGSLPAAAPPAGTVGSIPAHTGKPSKPANAARRSGVYPRPHGEAWGSS